MSSSAKSTEFSGEPRQTSRRTVPAATSGLGSYASPAGRTILLLLVTATPWCFGGTEPGTQFWLCGGVLTALGCWALGQFLSPSLDVSLPTALLPLCCAVGLGLFQLLPMPIEARSGLSPRGTELRQLLATEANPSDTAMVETLRLQTASLRQPLSLYPAGTRSDLAILVVGVAVFLLGATLFRTPQTQVWLCAALALNGAAIALFGIVQRLTFNGLVYWRVPLTQGGQPFGPFVNRNNAGGFLNLCLAGALGLTIWALTQRGFLRPVDKSRSKDDVDSRPSGGALREFLACLDAGTIGALLLTICIGAGIVCTLSRGAMLATLGTIVVTGGVLLFTRRWLGRLGWLGLVLVGVLALVSWLGMTDLVQARFRTLASDAIATQSRLPNWGDALRAVPDYWLWGSGLGTYRFVYGLYQRAPSPVWFYHAENQYLEVLLETGIVGLVLLLSTLFLVGAAALRLLHVDSRGRTLAMGVAGVAALAGQVIAGTFDFGLWLPANLLLMALLGGAIAGRAADLASGKGWSRHLVLTRRPLVCRIISIAFLGALFWSAAEIAQMTRVDRAVQTAELFRAQPNSTAEGLRFAARELRAAIGHRTDDMQAQQLLAELAIQRYSNSFRELLSRQTSMAAKQEDLQAATQPSFLHARLQQYSRTGPPDRVEKIRNDPLVRDNLAPALEHLIWARRACPLVPQVHLRIAELALLAAGPAADELSIQRARRLAPAQPDVLYSCGVLEYQAQRTEAALAYWRESLSKSADFLPQILRLAEPLLAQDSTVEHLFPDQPTLLINLAREKYGEQPQRAIQQALLRRATWLIQEGDCPAEEKLYLKGVLLGVQGDYPAAISQLTQAVQLRVQDPHWRYELAIVLQRQGLIEEAHEQAQTCALLDPQNAGYRKLLQTLNRARSATDLKKSSRTLPGDRRDVPPSRHDIQVALVMASGWTSNIGLTAGAGFACQLG